MSNKTGLTASKAWQLRVREKSIKYYIQGKTNLKEVAARISEEETRPVSFTTVYNNIKKAIREWDKENKEIITEYKLRELARIDHLEAEAWAAFERSCLPIRTIQKKQTPVEQPQGRKKKNTPALTLNEEILTIRESPGDKKFLDTVQWCIDKRLEVMATMQTATAEADRPGNTTVNNTTIRQIIIGGRPQNGSAQAQTITVNQAS